MMQRVIAAVLFAGVLLCPLSGESPAGSDGDAKQGPIQAELLAYLNVRHVADGAAVFARTTADWSGTDCILRRGAILEAKVENASPISKGAESSVLALSFTRAQCSGQEMKPFDLVLAAVAAPPSIYTNVTTGVTLPIGSFSNPNGNGLPGFGSSGIGDRTTTHLEFMGVQHSFPMRTELRPGDVIDIKGLKLEVGTGPNQSSVLTSKNRDLFLGQYTQFLLVPASVAFRPSGGTPVALHSRNTPDASQPPMPPPPHAAAFVDSLETCAPPGCAVDLPVTTEELSRHAEASIPVRTLGYTPSANKVIDGFDHEDTLAWLGPQELLLAMNPHTLIRRDASSKKNAPVRVIRAVLLDTGSHAVMQAVDWELADFGRYLWQLDGNRILVHVGNELRVYSSGLKVEFRTPLTGPLAFVRIAPNGKLIAVATLRERHSAELHAKLREGSGGEPEEDVDVLILDKEFKTIGGTSTSSGLLPPTLLNEGQVKLLAQPKNRYRLAMSTWDNKTATLARFASLCTPDLSSVAPDLLFLMTCDQTSGATEYRVLRADGKLLLTGKAGPREVGQDAIGNNQNQTFAVKVVRANRELSSGGWFRGSELESEEVRVYRASDGKRLLAVRVEDPGTNRGDYALSPDGSQLAILAGSEIRLFPVPPAK
jgi:hypothetical protein